MCEKKHKEELIWTSKKLKPQNQKAKIVKTGSRKGVYRPNPVTYYYFFEQFLLLCIFWTEVFNKILSFSPSSITAGLPIRYEPTKNQFANEPEGLR